MDYEEIIRIPELLKTNSYQETADILGVKKYTIEYWRKRLKEEGYKIPKRKSGKRSKLQQI